MQVLVIGSGGREHALAWAVANVAREGDVFHVCHCVPEPASLHVFPGMYLPPDSDAEEEEVHGAVAMVRRRFGRRLADAGIAFEVHVLTAADSPDEISRALAELADRLGAACIVLAHHNRSGFRAWWDGSVSAAAARRCRTPTVVVH